MKQREKSCIWPFPLLLLPWIAGRYNPAFAGRFLLRGCPTHCRSGSCGQLNQHARGSRLATGKHVFGCSHASSGKKMKPNGWTKQMWAFIARYQMRFQLNGLLFTAQAATRKRSVIRVEAWANSRTRSIGRNLQIHWPLDDLVIVFHEARIDRKMKRLGLSKK